MYASIDGRPAGASPCPLYREVEVYGNVSPIIHRDLRNYDASVYEVYFKYLLQKIECRSHRSAANHQDIVKNIIWTIYIG